MRLMALGCRDITRCSRGRNLAVTRSPYLGAMRFPFVSVFGIAGEVVRLLDSMITAGSLDNARAGVLEARARERARAELEESEGPGLAYPA